MIIALSYYILRELFKELLDLRCLFFAGFSGFFSLLGVSVTSLGVVGEIMLVFGERTVREEEWGLASP